MIVRIVLEVDGTPRRARLVPETVVPRLRAAIERAMGRAEDESDQDMFMRFLHRACSNVMRDTEAALLSSDWKSNFDDPIEPDDPPA